MLDKLLEKKMPPLAARLATHENSLFFVLGSRVCCAPFDNSYKFAVSSFRRLSRKAVRLSFNVPIALNAEHVI